MWVARKTLCSIYKGIHTFKISTLVASYLGVKLHGSEWQGFKMQYYGSDEKKKFFSFLVETDLIIKLVPIFPRDEQLPDVHWTGFSWNGSVTMTKQEISKWKMEVSLEIGCLPCAVGKQSSMPLINLERKWMLGWWWWWSVQTQFRYLGHVWIVIIIFTHINE